MESISRKREQNRTCGFCNGRRKKCEKTLRYRRPGRMMEEAPEWKARYSCCVVNGLDVVAPKLSFYRQISSLARKRLRRVLSTLY